MIRGGRSLVSSLPAFSNDGKKLLVCTASTVSIFSTFTGLQIGELEGHTALVTSVIIVPATTPASKILCYCWTASLDGTIRYWDFSVAELMKTINIKTPIHSMVIPGLVSQPLESSEKSMDVFAYISSQDIKQKDGQTLSWQIQKCNLTKSRLAGGVILTKSKKPQLITLSSSGKYIGFCENHKIRIWEVQTKDSDHAIHRTIRLHHTKKLSILAFHPTERIVAVGDVTGRILIWRHFGERTFSVPDKLENREVIKDAEERPGVRGDDDADLCTTWHWHSAEVRVLFFSSDGAYLYSGGREGVLVRWQLDTGKRNTQSRIGSPLSYFTNSPDHSLSSVSCADNRLQLLEMPSMKMLRSISGIKPNNSVPERYNLPCSDAAFDSTAGLVAICTENYCIQLFSMLDDREISLVQVCERNHQPVDEVTVIVNMVALSPDGCTMSTVETRLPEEGIGGLVCLKFWTSGSQNKDFSLSTVIYEPHRDGGVSAITFHPTRNMAVSSSYGAEFKIWACNSDVQHGDQMNNAGWTCHAVGSYKKKPMTAAAFSADGSVLAVAAERVITLWDPDRNVLVATIGESFEPISCLSFIGKSEYLVSSSQGSNPQVSVWSMSKLSISWSCKIHAKAVSCAMDGSSFAILALLPDSARSKASNEPSLNSVDGVILLYNVETPVPLATWLVKKAQGGGIGFILRSDKSEEDLTDGKRLQMLCYINSDHEYVLFDPYSQQLHDQTIIQRHKFLQYDEIGKSGYASMYGELPEFHQNPNQTSAATSVPSGRPWETLCSGPSYALPLSKLCSKFLETFMEKRMTPVE
nr:WD repeat-containing protein 75 [Ipomoea batatas]GME03454.1 WD repeat-containing protein 75 [Ipomoea batatas]